MTQTKTVREFLKYEKHFNFSSLNNRDKKLWSLMRIYYSEAFCLGNSPGQVPSKSILSSGLKSIIYGIKNVFKRYQYICVLRTDQRKLVGGRLEHCFDHLPPHILENTLFIEMPSAAHVPINSLSHKRIISRYLLLLFEYTYIRCTSATSSMQFIEYIRNVEITLDINLNYEYFVKRFNASEFIMDIVLRIYRPRLFLCTVAYPIMGYVCAAKNLNIPVVEFQHGLIGTSHRAYNIDSGLVSEAYPDYVACWGKHEEIFFSNPHNCYVKDNCVFPVGNFYTDYLRQTDHQIQEHNIHGKSEFNVLIAVTMQDPVEDLMLSYIEKLARLDPKMGILILPRNRPHNFYNEWASEIPNVFTNKNVNSYQGIASCDLHTTCWSTMAFESLVLGKPNILMNLNGLSKSYLGDSLSKSEFTYFADTPECFVEFVIDLKGTNSKEVKNSGEKFFRSNSRENISVVIDKILKISSSTSNLIEKNSNSATRNT